MSVVKMLRFIIAIIFVICISCDDALQPIHESTALYSYYASLDMNEEVNHIRVRELTAPFTAEATEEIDAVVTLKNLYSGEVQILKHERQVYEDIYFHNFAVEKPVEPDTEYELTITRSDGRSVSATAHSPARVVPLVEPENRDCYTTINVELEPVNSGTIQIGYILEVPGDTIDTPLATLPLNESNGSFSHSFIPNVIVTAWTFFNCHQLQSAEIGFYYKYYGPGFYERITHDSLDILESTKLFGVYYEDTIRIPIDISM